MKALVSIIMPVYNTPQEYLEKSIESCIAQTYRPIELILINDGSTSDHIDSTIKRYEDRLPINYIKLETNKGAANARNAGLAQAKGEYIAFLDSDDLAHQTRIEKQVRFLTTHPDIGMVGSECKTIPHGKTSVSPRTDAAIKACALFFRCPALQSTVMLRYDLIQKHHIQYRTDYVPAEDYALWLDLLPHTNFAVLKDVLVHYRQHADSISKTEPTRQINVCRQIVVDYWYKHFQLPESLKSKIYNFLTYNPTTENDFNDVEAFYKLLLPQIKQAAFLNDKYALYYLGKLHKKIIRKDRTGIFANHHWSKRLHKIIPMGYFFHLQKAWKAL